MSVNALDTIKGEIKELKRILNAVEAGTATRKEKSLLPRAHKTVLLGFNLLEQAIRIVKLASPESAQPSVKMAKQIASAYLSDPESAEKELEKLRKIIPELDRKVKSAQAKIKGMKSA